MNKVEQEDINTDIVTVEAEEVVEESPLLVAQRYLNIFRQIHIFKAAKKAEFDNELLNLPEKIKKILITLPGGRILLEHILELEEQNDYDTQLTKALIAQKKKQDPLDFSGSSNIPALTHTSSEVRLGSDFANTLAKSLATALGNTILPPPIIGTSTPITSTDENGKQVNTQNNAAATTVNNFHVDYSIFQNLADAIRENSKLQLEEMKTFSRTLTDAILGRNSAKNTPIYDKTLKTDSKFNKNSAIKTSLDGNNIQTETRAKTQTISVTNKIVNPKTSQSTVQKTSYSIPATDSTATSKPQIKDPLLQAQMALSRTGLNVKPISLSVDEPVQTTVSATADNQNQNSYTEYKLDENFNFEQKTIPDKSAEEEWEYVDEYGNPVSADDYGDWEYVDEYGNPIPTDAAGEWEYVEETQASPSSLDVAKEIKSDIPSKTKSLTEPKFSDKEDNTIQTESKEKPEEKVSKEEKPTTESADIDSNKEKTGKEEKAAGFFSSLFKKKPTEEAAETPKEEKMEEQKKDSADDILAAAFNSEPTETPKEEKMEEQKKDSADDILAAAFNSEPAETPKEEKVEEQKKDSANDILAAAFNSEPAEAPKEEKKPRMGGILAEAYQEVEREQKTLSSKDLLAQAFKSKPQTSEELLNSALQKPEEKSSADDALSQAFAKPEEKSSADDALAQAFAKPEEKSSADDALAQAFAKPEEKSKHDPEFEALLKAFSS